MSSEAIRPISEVIYSSSCESLRPYKQDNVIKVRFKGGVTCLFINPLEHALVYISVII